MSTTHDLYVKVSSVKDPDHKSRELTLEVLNYIASNFATFKQMGITVRVTRVRAQDLQNSRLIKAMHDRGIARLPALATQRRVYTGFGEIREAYDRSIQEYSAYVRSRATAARERVAVAPSLDVDDLSAFYENEMSLAGGDDEEEGIGKTDMMEKYRGAASGRERQPARGPRQRSQSPQKSGRGGPPPRGARSDNIAHHAPAHHAHSDDEDMRENDDNDEISGTINRLSRDIDSSLRAKAFSTTGGDDDGENAQDDLMEQAFYANVSSSDVY